MLSFATLPVPVIVPLLLLLAPSPPLPSVASDLAGAQQQDAVREAVRKGRLVPLEQVLADALRRRPGTLVEVKLEDNEYEIEILGADGVVIELEYDAISGRLLKIEV